jgi:KUP system potassium uptake protein
MTAVPRGTPSALLHNVKHNQVLHEAIVVLTISTEPIPHVPPDERVEVQPCGDGFHRVIARYGFMETPNVPELLCQCSAHGLVMDITKVTFFLGRETLIATKRPGMALWREHLFAFMSRNAQRATDYFQIPAEQAIEIGVVVEM